MKKILNDAGKTCLNSAEIVAFATLGYALTSCDPKTNCTANQEYDTATKTCIEINPPVDLCEQVKEDCAKKQADRTDLDSNYTYNSASCNCTGTYTGIPVTGRDTIVPVNLSGGGYDASTLMSYDRLTAIRNITGIKKVYMDFNSKVQGGQNNGKLNNNLLYIDSCLSIEGVEVYQHGKTITVSFPLADSIVQKYALRGITVQQAQTGSVIRNKRHEGFVEMMIEQLLAVGNGKSGKKDKTIALTAGGSNTNTALFTNYIQSKPPLYTERKTKVFV